MKNKLLRSIAIVLTILLNIGNHTLHADTNAREAYLLELLKLTDSSTCTDAIPQDERNRVEEILGQMTVHQKFLIKQLLGYERKTC